MISYFPSSKTHEAVSSLNRTSTWRRLQANITPSHYNRIQRFQKERQQQYHSLTAIHPIMLSSLYRESAIDTPDHSKLISNLTNSYLSPVSLLLDTSTNLCESNTDSGSIQTISSDQNLLDSDKKINVDSSIIYSDKDVDQFEIDPREHLALKHESKLVLENNCII